jgi:hypothetical protein
MKKPKKTPAREKTVIHFSDYVNENRPGIKMNETVEIMENLLEKLDMFRVRLSESRTSIQDMLPLVHSMKVEKNHLSECCSSNDREFNEIINGVVRVADTEVDTFENGYYF